MRPTIASPLAVWAGLIVLYVVWGSTYLGMKLAMDTLPPFVMGFARFVPAGVLLAGGVAVFQRRSIRRPTGRELRDAAIVGTLLLTGGTGLVAWGEQTVQTGIAALLIGLVPMWLAVYGRVLFRDRIPIPAAVGIAIGLLGIAILAWPAGGVGQLDPAGLVALVISPMLWSSGTIYAARKAILPGPALFATGLEMVAGGLGFLVVAVLTGEFHGFDATAVSATSWLGVGYLVVVGSLIGFTTFTWLLTVAPLHRVSTYAYVNPVVAVFLGWLLVGEPLTPRLVVAAVVIVAAVALIVSARGRQAPAEAAPAGSPEVQGAAPAA